jgi:hypothetical protein
VNFIESGSSTAANSTADLRITNVSNGSTYMTITSAGNVGIGTTTPSQKLHVTSSSNNFIRIESNQNLAGEVSGIEFGIPAFSSATRSKITSTTFNGDASDLKFLTGAGADSSIVRMILATSGNVGIGTTSPSELLNINGNIRLGPTSDSNTEYFIKSAGQIVIHANDASSQDDAFVGTIIKAGSSSNLSSIEITGASSSVYKHINFITQNTQRMILNSAGNVGIGTTSPGEKLVINGKMELTDGVIRRGGSSVTGTTDLGLYSRVSGNWMRYVTNNGDHAFFTGDGNNGAGSDERMRIATNGEVVVSGNLRANGSINIGSTANASGDTLDIKGSLRVRRGDTNPWDAIKMYTAYDSGLAEERAWISAENAAYFTFITSRNGTSMTLKNNTGLGIGLVNPSYQLHLSGDSAGKPNGGSWANSSDVRLKESIELADIDLCYNIIKELPLKRYRWKDNAYTDEQIKDRHVVGWIAQDIQQVFPKAVEPHVFTNIDGTTIDDCLTLNETMIIRTLYGCVQKLMKDFEDYKESHP